MMTQLLLFLIIICCLKATHSRSASSKSGNYAAPSGQTIHMSCIPPNVFVDKLRIKGRRSFIWTDEEGREIVNPRMETLNDGALQIKHVHQGDSGIYHCKFRPLEALEHNGAPSKIFEHKLIVYELPGHKFKTTVNFDVTKFGSETTITVLRELFKSRICTTEICAAGPVTSQNCEVTDTEKQMCQISMTYEALEPPPRAKCNETCIRQEMIDRLKKAQETLESTLLADSEDSKSRLKPDLHTFDTEHLITCKAGYHLIESNFENCFPCLPGTYSEAETLKCEFCPIGFYQERYGSHECAQCSGDLTTETVGSKSRDDCRPITDTGILKDIREGIAALFRG